MIISIDGASRKNGTPDCISTGGVFIRPRGDEHGFEKYVTSEIGSTNQRGELLALIKGLEIGLQLAPETTYLVTDSEYIFNCLTKEWYKSWASKGWITAAGEPVKNQDLWHKAASLYEGFHDCNLEIVVYHIKGHVIPFGKVTALNLINFDPSCETLYREVDKKLKSLRVTKRESIDNALKLFQTNNGFVPPYDVFEEMIVCNITADLIATHYIEQLV